MDSPIEKELHSVTPPNLADLAQSLLLTPEQAIHSNCFIHVAPLRTRSPVQASFHTLTQVLYL